MLILHGQSHEYIVDVTSQPCNSTGSVCHSSSSDDGSRVNNLPCYAVSSSLPDSPSSNPSHNAAWRAAGTTPQWLADVTIVPVIML
nr:hypothetical protein CFP56_21139 [Quercus suber]